MKMVAIGEAGICSLPTGFQLSLNQFTEPETVWQRDAAQHFLCEDDFCEPFSVQLGDENY